MDFEYIIQFIRDNFSNFDYMVFSLNLFIFVFSKQIVARFSNNTKSKADRRLFALRFINAVLFILYFIAVWFTQWARNISQTGLTLLFGYVASHVIHKFMVERFGRSREVNGEVRKSETYQSSMFALVGYLFVIVCVFLFIVNIWDFQNYLGPTSVVGGMLIVAFSTKDVWAPENINGLILLYNDNVQPGSVVQVNEHQLLGIVIQTTLTQTVFYDLRMRHQVLLPNSKFRTAKVEVLNNSPAKGIRRFIDFNIGYGIAASEVEAFLEQVWETAAAKENAINADVKPRIRILNNGDHAVTWRMFFTVSNVYRFLEAEYAVNHAAYELSLETGIGLDTPTTHRLLEMPASAETKPTA